MFDKWSAIYRFIYKSKIKYTNYKINYNFGYFDNNIYRDLNWIQIYFDNWNKYPTFL